MAKRIVCEHASQDLSAAAFSLKATSQGQMKIALATVKASEGITETVTLTIDQAEGSTYDVILDTSPLNSETDYIYQSRGSEIILNHGDAVVLACTDANDTGVVYGKLILIET